MEDTVFLWQMWIHKEYLSSEKDNFIEKFIFLYFNIYLKFPWSAHKIEVIEKINICHNLQNRVSDNLSCHFKCSLNVNSRIKTSLAAFAPMEQKK